MRLEPQPAASNHGCVVHLVGRVTDEVFSFLGPATAAIARSGSRQTVVLIDDLRYRRHLASLREFADVILTPSLRNPLRQWRAVRRAFEAQLDATRSVRAVHLHGVLPCLACGFLVRARASSADVFFSPHASRLIATLPAVGSLLLYLVKPLLGQKRSAAIVNRPAETAAFDGWRATELVESPVADVFFSVPRREAAHPTVLTGGRDQGAGSAELVAQFAVLLSGQALQISFNWIGNVDAATRAALKAADVGILEIASDADCAARLSCGWIYLAAGPTRGFPVFLVEAMAAGLPCVAMDCAQHRDVIDDGKTGYLCASERAMIERVAMLIDDPATRQRIGTAARESARHRFIESKFEARLLSAYAQER